MSENHSILFLIFEALGFLAFAIILAREIYLKNWQRVLEIISCAIFGMILEIGDSSLSHSYYTVKNF